MTTRKIQAALLSLSLLLPAAGAFAQPHHYYYQHRHYHHYSQTRGAVIGAVSGAVIDHRQPLKGALIGGALGEGVQMLRNHHKH
jgi:hypothetical protein